MLQYSPDECESSTNVLNNKDATSTRTSPEDLTALNFINKRSASRPKTQSYILKMLETETFHKETLSPFNPLPKIGQKVENVWEDKFKDRTIRSMNELILNNLNKRKKSAQIYHVGEEELSDSDKTIPALNEVNLRNHRLSIIKTGQEEKHTDLLKEIKENKAKMLLRQQTYHVIDPVFTLDPMQNSDSESNRNLPDLKPDKNNNFEPLEKSSTSIMFGPKTFETRRRLLDRREREVIVMDPSIIEKDRLNFKSIRQSKSDGTNDSGGPAKINDLIEIFDSLQISRKYKEKVKKPNYWF